MSTYLTNSELLYKIYVNALKMLDLREIAHDKTLTYEQFEEAYIKKNKSIFIDLKTDVPAVLYIANSSSFGKVELEKVIKNKYDIKHFIFIIDKNNVDMILTKTKNEYTNIKIDIMLYREFIINPIEHELAPIYHMIVGEERKKIFDEYGKDNIAKMLRSDIVARWFDAQPGDLFKIIKKTGMSTAPYSLKYRIVI